MYLEKNQLRREFRKKRNALSEKEVNLFSQEISKNFLNNLLPKILEKIPSIIFSLYVPANNEVDTSNIAAHFISNDIEFSYPKIINSHSPLEFILYKKQQLAANKDLPKIMEPIDGTKVTPNIIILPLLAFDSDLSRLGMGGGFFDRTINSLKIDNSKLITIGLAFDFQRFQGTLPIIKTDQKLDFIVTQNKIYVSN